MQLRIRCFSWIFTGLLLAGVLSANAWGEAPKKEYQSGIIWPEPKIVDPGPEPTAIVPPPSDALVLFDGKDLSQWKNGEKWEIKDGYAVARQSSIETKRAFGDCQLHVEFATPPEVKGRGQARGNSGVYLMGLYEVQVLDSYKNKTYHDGQCGAIYKQQPPLVNACRGPGKWQTYDIIFKAPRFDKQGKVLQAAYITVLQNGIVIHDHHKLQGGTYYFYPASYKKHAEKLPLKIQFHRNPVQYRNIWIRENVQPLIGKQP